MATLKEYFETDFASVDKVSNTFRLAGSSLTVEVIGSVHFDYNSNTSYLSCYIPDCDTPLEVCVSLLNNFNKLLEIGNSLEIHTHFPGEKPIVNTDLRFSGRIFVYSESPIPDDSFEKLQIEAKNNGIFLQYRGPMFAQKRSEIEKPLAFISHDSRDKDDVARPIAIGLTRLMCPIWFDEFSLKVGDRLRESIEKGIRECKKCVLILSPNFLSNPSWTKTEFNSIFTRELIEGTDFLLPVWYGVEKREIFDYSPTLIDRLGVKWDLGEKEVVRRLYQAITAKANP